MKAALRKLAATLAPKAEPLLWLALLTSIADAVQQNTTNGTINWQAAAPVIAALVLRNFVTSPATRQSIEDDLKAAQETIAHLHQIQLPAIAGATAVGLDALNSFEHAWTAPQPDVVAEAITHADVARFTRV